MSLSRVYDLVVSTTSGHRNIPPFAPVSERTTLAKTAPATFPFSGKREAHFVGFCLGT
jgi:hypothetical protein